MPPHAQEPRWFTTAPVGAMKLLARPAGRFTDVDLWEINEAFAVVTMAAMKEMDLPHDKVNVHGGACALGHPIGASGAHHRHPDRRTAHGLKRGVASLCIGGGRATVAPRVDTSADPDVDSAGWFVRGTGA